MHIKYFKGVKGKQKEEIMSFLKDMFKSTPWSMKAYQKEVEKAMPGIIKKYSHGSSALQQGRFTTAKQMRKNRKISSDIAKKLRRKYSKCS